VRWALNAYLETVVVVLRAQTNEGRGSGVFLTFSPLLVFVEDVAGPAGEDDAARDGRDDDDRSRRVYVSDSMRITLCNGPSRARDGGGEDGGEEEGKKSEKEK